MTINKNIRCALVKYSGKNPFNRCLYCSFPLYKCLSFQVSLSFLAVTFLAVLLTDVSNSFSRIYLVSIIGILLFISWIIYLETDRIIEAEHRAQEVLRRSLKDKEEIRHHYDTQSVVGTLLKYSLKDTSLPEI